jgi:DNA-directed RNA polymerase specialized sigma24 family protein
MRRARCATTRTLGSARRHGRSERLAQLDSAAPQPTPSQWEYFRLHHLEDVPIDDIARRGGLSRDAVKSHLYRARKLLLAR